LNQPFLLMLATLKTFPVLPDTAALARMSHVLIVLPAGERIP